jgi:N-acetylglucosamine kinase-like BadF-type ATPase
MSIIIADSGSTKTQWNIVNPNGTINEFFSIGINPYFISNNEIEQSITRVINSKIRESIKSLFFYGSGCSLKEKCDIVSNSLSRVFPNARIEVYSDLLASGRALFGKGQGIACILGTGSNVAVFENDKFTQSINSLGYILGDQASGAYIGKELVRSYFQEDMPLNLRKKFDEFANINLSDVLERVYKQDFPNRYLASFTPFASENIEDEFITTLITEAITKFINLQLGSLEFNKEDYKIGFVGSVAYYFRHILTAELNKRNYNTGKIIKAPMEGLIEYHLGAIK